jgi:hypothetical protein
MRKLPLLFLLFALILSGPLFSQNGTPHGVFLNWTASTSPSVTYNVYRGTSASGPWAKLNSAPLTGTTYLDPVSNVLTSTTYSYAVTAVDPTTGSESVFSNIAIDTTPAAFPVNPGPPSGCTAKNQ